MLRLVRPLDGHADVIGLFPGKRGELGAKLVEVQARDFLVEFLVEQGIEIGLSGLGFADSQGLGRGSPVGLAGGGGAMEASLHTTGDPKSGDLVELKVIAAVVVGGTSLAGGQGRITGTLIGAFIIAVINNGMNLTGVESHMQKVIYGSVILVAVLIDRLKIHLLKLKKN